MILTAVRDSAVDADAEAVHAAHAAYLQICKYAL